MKKEKRIVLVGGGDHCKSVIEVIELQNIFEIAGIVDIKQKIGQKISGYTIFATDNDLPNLVQKYKYFLITVGHIKTNKIRLKIYNLLKKLNASLPVITSPIAYISKKSHIGEGTVIMHYALVNSGVKIGNNCIINTKALLEHDTVIENNCHISTAAIVNGDCIVKENCFIGSNSVVLNGITIETDSIVGAGSVVVNNIDKNQIVFGNPAKAKK